MPISALPKICYELSNGTDAAGFGPSLSGGTFAAGLLGNGLSEDEVLAASSPGIDVNANLSLGFWVNITAGMVDGEGFDDKIGTVTIDDGAKFFELRLYSEADGTVTFQVNGGGAALVTYNHTPAAGWHHYAVSRTSGTATLYLDGVSVASGSAASGTSAAAQTLVNGLLTVVDQAIIHDAAYSAADWLYIVNGGSGIAYASMSTGGGAGAPNSYGMGYFYGYSN